MEEEEEEEEDGWGKGEEGAGPRRQLNPGEGEQKRGGSLDGWMRGKRKMLFLHSALLFDGKRGRGGGRKFELISFFKVSFWRKLGVILIFLRGRQAERRALAGGRK